MIAMALACEPRLLIADEPTTALDVTIQAQILELMRELQQKTGAAIVLITHDLGVVAEMAAARRRDVCRAQGRGSDGARIVRAPATPVHARSADVDSEARRPQSRGRQRRRLAEIAGTVPSLSEPIVGCAFAPRCRYAVARCRSESPPLEEKAIDHFAACWESDRIVARADDARATMGLDVRRVAHRLQPDPATGP